jgi:hypothetical protein
MKGLLMTEYHRTTMYIPSWMWQQAQEIAYRESRESGKRTATASGVIMEAACGKRPPLQPDDAKPA